MHTEFSAAEAALKAGLVEEALQAYHAITVKHPESAKAWFELAGAYDLLGREREALPHYEQTAALGDATLPPEDRPRLYVQWGSTLRNLQKFEAAQKVLDEGLAKFPGYGALLAFRGLVAYSYGSHREAARLFLSGALAADGSIEEYSRALRFYREKLDTFPCRQRKKMRFRLHEAKPTSVRGSPVTTAPPLGRLMHAAYTGTIDSEGETEEQCLAEMEGTLGGKYGPFLANASFVELDGEKAVSASLVTLWKGEPLLAFSMTDPAYQGRGLAGGLILRSLETLKAAGYRDLILVVTEENPAEKLYRKLGFEDMKA